ncbi:Hypp1114 [Branchiostoma lanceolatum]|uniref:Hypp1114 protein n=2 Tax=Branchiostoma lanceolatum TaxID=7740 RepID=A0A8K0EHD1_BRALA|nr:Hypp1114 [Branchiostoma lanceolatum]
MFGKTDDVMAGSDSRQNRHVTTPKSRRTSQDIGGHVGRGRSRIWAKELRAFARMGEDLNHRANASPPAPHRRRRHARVASGSSSDSVPSRGRSPSTRPKTTKIKSGILRKATDEVKRKIEWPQERLPCTKDGGVQYFDMKLHEYMAGEMDIILSRRTDEIQSQRRLELLHFMAFEIGEYGFKAVLQFNAHVLRRDFEEPRFMKEVLREKMQHLRREEVKSPGSSAKTGSSTDIRVCYPYQRGECQATVDESRAHSSKSGKLYHYCQPSAKFRPYLGHQLHPASMCKYKDPDYRAKQKTVEKDEA